MLTVREELLLWAALRASVGKQMEFLIQLCYKIRALPPSLLDDKKMFLTICTYKWSKGRWCEGGCFRSCKSTSVTKRAIFWVNGEKSFTFGLCSRIRRLMKVIHGGARNEYWNIFPHTNSSCSTFAFVVSKLTFYPKMLWRFDSSTCFVQHLRTTLQDQFFSFLAALSHICYVI